MHLNKFRAQLKGIQGRDLALLVYNDKLDDHESISSILMSRDNIELLYGPIDNPRQQPTINNLLALLNTVSGDPDVFLRNKTDDVLHKIRGIRNHKNMWMEVLYMPVDQEPPPDAKESDLNHG